MATEEKPARIETVLSQAGSRWDALTGAVVMPIYQTATFRHPALGQSTGFDYSRTTNPTRQALERTMAALEGGARGFAFASGLAAIDAALHLVPSGTRLAVTEDLYGGTFRLLERVYRGRGIAVDYVDTSHVENVERALAAGAARSERGPARSLTGAFACHGDHLIGKGERLLVRGGGCPSRPRPQRRSLTGGGQGARTGRHGPGSPASRPDSAHGADSPGRAVPQRLERPAGDSNDARAQ